jgi:hypothetical protein
MSGSHETDQWILRAERQREEHERRHRYDDAPGTPTHEQIEALRQYAAEHGRNWKSQLNADWMNGQSSGPLQQIRNQFGPSWLVRFQLPKVRA